MAGTAPFWPSGSTGTMYVFIRGQAQLLYLCPGKCLWNHNL